MTQPIAETTTLPSRAFARKVNRLAYKIARHWVLVFSFIYGLFVSLPFLAPVLMSLHFELPAQVIYTIYSFLCHQLPERSFFLFGQKFTYSLAEITSVWRNSNNILILRQFVGTPTMGWKVAWSDRMVSLFTSILFFAWIWYPLRRRIPRLHWLGLLLLTAPLAVDGLTHMISDFAGLGQGFRDSNAWLAALTRSSFAPTFYAGDAWGSFNSLMRLFTGILFGAGIVWFGFPYVSEYFDDLKLRIEEKFARKGLSL